MSESTTTSAPAPADSGDTGPVIGPAPASQPAISVSEAARLLSSQRRAQAKDGEAAPESTDRKPSPNEMVSAPAAKPAQAPAATPAAKAADTGLTALERALGVPGAEPDAAPAEAADAIEIEGQRYSRDQLREAVLKAGDYTKKTQEIAERSRNLQVQQDAIATVLPYIQPELARLAEVVNAGAARPPASLMATDPQRYAQEMERYEHVVAEKERLANLTALQQQARERAMQAQVAAANEQLIKEFPFWANAEERTAAQKQIVEWATTKGEFRAQELNNLTDPRQLKTLMKAMAFDRMVAGNKTAAPAAKTSAPVRGSAPPPAPTERIQVAEQAFDARPNLRNAAQLLAARRSNGSMPR